MCHNARLQRSPSHGTHYRNPTLYISYASLELQVRPRFPVFSFCSPRNRKCQRVSSHLTPTIRGPPHKSQAVPDGFLLKSAIFGDVFFFTCWIIKSALSGWTRCRRDKQTGQHGNRSTNPRSSRSVVDLTWMGLLLTNGRIWLPTMGAKISWFSVPRIATCWRLFSFLVWASRFVCSRCTVQGQMTSILLHHPKAECNYVAIHNCSF